MTIQNLKHMAEAFKESSNNDLQIIEILYEKGNDNILIFYHLQQALEKILKAAVIENSSKIQTYDSIKKTISHNLEKSSFELIDELCNYYIQKY